MIADYLEFKPWYNNHLVGSQVFFTVAIFMQFFVTNWLYWLFAIKYWVISIEIPHMFAEQNQEFAEDKEVV